MENSEKIEKFANILKNSSHICVFSGAGISVPSGIPDFRSADGLYNTNSSFKIPPEQIISHSFFTQRTEDFYNLGKMSPRLLGGVRHYVFSKGYNPLLNTVGKADPLPR